MRGGADDYITKPFNNEELLVHIEAVLRRCQQSVRSGHELLRFKDLSLNTDTMEVKIGDCPISLTRYEYLILQLLMSAPSRVFTKNNIFESVWNETFFFSHPDLSVQGELPMHRPTTTSRFKPPLAAFSALRFFLRFCSVQGWGCSPVKRK